MDIFEQFSTAFQSAPGPMLIADSTGSIVFTNDALNVLFEYQPAELIGKSVESLVPPEVRAIHPDLRQAYLHLPSSRMMGTSRDLFGATRSGRLIPVEIGLNHVVSGDERFVIASVLDISERIRQEERTRLALDAAASAIIMTNSSGNVVLANNQAEVMFGYAADELIGEPIDNLVPKRVRRRHGVYRTSFTADASKRSMGTGTDLNGLRKDGTEFPVEIGLTPIRNDGETLIMATVLDVSDRRRTEREIQKKNQDLTRLNAELAQFAYSASHDLKAPLASIEGFLHIIEEDADAGDLSSVVEHARRAREMAAKLKSLVEDILGLARAENIDDPNEDIDMAQLVTAVIRQSAVAAEERSVNVVVEMIEGLTVHSQPTRIRQIIENLVGNSIKYADADKPAPYVRVRSSLDDNWLNLSVEDNGIGIPSESQPDVFKLFKRFGNHASPGSGLGLALVKQHTESLGGDISFNSDVSGTRFNVRVPAIRG